VVSGSAADEPSASRRSLLVSLGAGAAGVLRLAGCGSSAPRRSASPQVNWPVGTADEADLLNALLGNEYFAIAAYTAATPLLTGAASRVARQFLGQEVLHADRLIHLIQKAGGAPQRAQASYDLGQPGSAGQLMTLLLAAEHRQIRAYVQAVPQLTSAQLRSTVASILATQARHAALWRLQLGQRPAPTALVTGDE